MLNDFKNLALTVLYIYLTAYAIGFIFALIKNRTLLKQQFTYNISTLDKFLITGFLILVSVAMFG